MKIKQKLVVAANSMSLSIATVLLPLGKSIANTIFVEQYTNNYFVKHSHVISQKIIVEQPVVFQSVLGKFGSEQSNLISCWNQERSPFTSSIELLMRLLIIGSFGSVGVAGYSSFAERYFKIINKDLKIIYYSIFVLLTLQIIASAIAMMPSSANPISSAIRTNSSCSLGNL